MTTTKPQPSPGNGETLSPSDWPVVPLGEVAHIVSGLTLGRPLREKVTRKVPYLRVANVKDGRLDLSDVYEIDATEDEIEKCRLRHGDLLLTEGGDPDKLGRGTFWQEQIPECIHQNHIFRVANVKDGWLDLTHIKQVEATEQEIRDCRLRFGDLVVTEGGDPDKLGRGTFWQEQLPEYIHQNRIFRVRFNLANFAPAFVAFQFGSPYGKAYFLAHAKQTTGIATINRTVLSKFPLLVPPLAEQRAVSAKLEAEQMEAASLTRTLTEKLTAIDHLPAALLREAFNGHA